MITTFWCPVPPHYLWLCHVCKQHSQKRWATVVMAASQGDAHLRSAHPEEVE